MINKKISIFPNLETSLVTKIANIIQIQIVLIKVYLLVVMIKIKIIK